MNTDKIYAESLANEYAPKDTSRVQALRKLDIKAKLPSEIFAYSFGIATTLLAGTGMSLAMEVIGGGDFTMKLLGIFIGVIGFFGAGINYLLYKRLRAHGRKKYAFEIMELAREIAEKE